MKIKPATYRPVLWCASPWERRYAVKPPFHILYFISFFISNRVEEKEKRLIDGEYCNITW